MSQEPWSRNEIHTMTYQYGDVFTYERMEVVDVGENTNKGTSFQCIYWKAQMLRSLRPELPKGLWVECIQVDLHNGHWDILIDFDPQGVRSISMDPHLI